MPRGGYRTGQEERNRKMAKDPRWRAAVAASNRKKAKDPVFRAKISKSLTRSVAWYENNSRRTKKGCLLYGSNIEGGGVARRVYTRRHGPLPPGVCVLHTCDTPNCIEDKHHFTGTKKDNSQDAERKGRLYHGSKNFVFNHPHTAKSKAKISASLKIAWAENRVRTAWRPRRAR